MLQLKVALVQYRAVDNNVAENLKSGLAYLQLAKDQGVDLVLFPEMWSNGYAPPFPHAFDDPNDPLYEKERQQWLNSALDDNSVYVQAFRQAAAELGIGLVLTYLSKGKTAPQNTALLIDKTGQVLFKYHKVHTCDFSLEALLESGSEFMVGDFHGIKLGVMICYDREFPESARVLMLKGAEIILVPNACEMNPIRLNQLSVRAFENMTGIAMANYPASGWGQSCAFSPVVFNESGYVDNKIAMADAESEALVSVDFDLAAIRAFRAQETWGNAYRKVQAYHNLLDERIAVPFIRETPNGSK